MKTFIFAAAIVSALTPAALFAQTPAATPQAVQVRLEASVFAGLPKTPDRNFASLSAAHEAYTQDFASKPGFGSSRIVFLPGQDFVTIDGSVYRFNTPDLIGLENDPVVYQRAGGIQNLSVDVMSKKELRSRLTRRPLTAVESNAIVELRAGKDLVTRREQVQVLVFNRAEAGRVEGIHAIGSLRAAANCAHCHGVKEGTLLGAFSYTLVATNMVAAKIPAPVKPAGTPIPSQPVQPVGTNLNFTLTEQFKAVLAGAFAAAAGR